MLAHDLFRITAAAPAVSVANPAANADATIDLIDRNRDDADRIDLFLMPELGLSGYTCGDLFASAALLDACIDALLRVADHSRDHDSLVVVGLPITVAGRLMNTAAILGGGRIHAIVPKTYLPTYREFYEGRHFTPASAVDPSSVRIDSQVVPFGTDLIVRRGDAMIAIEICEDFWTPAPPSSAAAMAGANILLNLSASNETIGKANWRRDLVRSQSGRCLAAYAYASAGPGESTADLVFGGHCLIAENGSILGESRRVGDGRQPPVFDESAVTVDIDLGRLTHDRRVIGSFHAGHHSADGFRVMELPTPRRIEPTRVLRRIDAHPFVPDESDQLAERCGEVFALQIGGLTKRLTRLPAGVRLTIGISGGLDSTLALLVALAACDAVEKPRKHILGLTMPGFGTSPHTKTSADRLIEWSDIDGDEIDIRPLCLDTFRAIKHSPLGIAIDETTTVDNLQRRLYDTPDDAKDLTFENVQARVRTMLLMNRGFVLGTGDMSEQALGWSTYNADHMSMYNVNASVPKTLVRFLVRFAADHYFGGELRQVLHRVADTPISPELMPTRADGSIRQDTEASVGAYELHDFFLYHFVRNGFTRQKIEFLARHARFDGDHDADTIGRTLDVFIDRFFKNQFKRNCVPDGPKVGSVSLSPRGDWRMPPDADADAFG